MDQLIGRRRELREAIRLLRDQSSTDAGIILTGVGGIGKSALAGRIAQRMFETHFLIGVHYGKLSLQSLCKTIGKTLKEEASSEKLANFGNELLKGDSDEIDLSMSLISVGLVSGAEGRRAIEMAREILVELDQAGRLPQSEKPTIEAIESILSQFEG